MINLPNEDPIQKYQFIHHFVPHPHHKTRALLLSHKALLFYTVILLVLFAFLKTLPALMPGVLGYASNINTQELLQETNNTRVRFGLEPLKYNDTLSQAARKKAEHMFAEDYWAHVSPSGVEPWDFILSEGYDYSYAGENLAKNFDESNQVVVAWYNSPSHRENLLNPNYDEIGFAVVNGELEGYETTLVVQMFGKSRTPTYTASASDTGSDSERVAPETSFVEDTRPTVAPVDVEVETIPTTSNAVLNSAIVTHKPSFFIDANVISHLILIVFIGFVIALLVLDIWYSKKKSVPKFTGHTMAHLGFLIVVLGSVLMVLTPGRIL